MSGDVARQALLDALDTSDRALDNFVLRGSVLADAEVLRFDLESEMAAGVAADVWRDVNALTRKQFLAYDPSYQTSSAQVLVEELDQVPELAAVDALVRLGDVALDSGGGQVVAMAHVVGLGANRVVAYRLKGSGIAARRSKGIPLIPRDGIYRPIDGDVLYYEPRFDAFTCAGKAYFIAATLIQTKLHAEDKARQLAKDTLDKVTATVSIDGFDQLQLAVMDDPSLRAKMASIARLLQSDAEYAKNLTTAKLVDFVETYPDYSIPVSTVKGQKSLRFDPSPQHRHKIPRLLADDYLHSYLTNRNYEAGSKQRMKA